MFHLTIFLLRDVEPTTTPTTTATTTTVATRTTTRTVAPTTTMVPLLADDEDILDSEESDEAPESRDAPNAANGQANTESGIEAFPDDYFDEEPIDNDTEDSDEDDGGILKTNTKQMTFYHCLFGGYGPSGPISAVGHVGAAFIRRNQPIIRPLPRAFPLGSQGIQATVYKKNLFVCSPGAALENPQFFSFFASGLRSFQPGQCYFYDKNSKSWKPYSSPMNSYRGGASITRMGRFIVV